MLDHPYLFENQHFLNGFMDWLIFVFVYIKIPFQRFVYSINAPWFVIKFDSKLLTKCFDTCDEEVDFPVFFVGDCNSKKFFR